MKQVYKCSHYEDHVAIYAFDQKEVAMVQYQSSSSHQKAGFCGFMSRTTGVGDNNNPGSNSPVVTLGGRRRIPTQRRLTNLG